MFRILHLHLTMFQQRFKCPKWVSASLGFRVFLQCRKDVTQSVLFVLTGV